MVQFQVCIQPPDIFYGNTVDSVTVWGEIYLEKEGYFFPERKWNDAVSSILDMWLSAICEFVMDNEDRCDLYFMDGPFMIRLNRLTGGLLNMSLIERTCTACTVWKQFTVLLFDLVDGILCAADSFVNTSKKQATDFCKTNTFRRIVDHSNTLKQYIKEKSD